MKVIKRDGRKVKFDKTKIKDAVLKAFVQVDGTPDAYAMEKAEKIAEYVEAQGENKELTVEEIQNMVEQGLMNTKRKDVARAYITYREERNKVRMNKTVLMSQVSEKIWAKNVQNQNANMDEFSFGGRKFEAAGVLMKEIALGNLISSDVAKAYRENRIYIHDMNNYATGMHNCLLVDLAKLLSDGFVTRNGDVRPPKSVSTAIQQVAVILQCQSQVQYGGCGLAHADYDLAPFVKMSFFKHYQDGLKYIEEISVGHPDNVESLSIEDEWYKAYPKAYKYAMDQTEKECLQAAQGLYHNLNTLESRAGSQLPFSSINCGRDTSPEGRMVTRSLLLASLDGIGKCHKTSIFPILIFQHKKGVNANPGDPNYDLKKLAIKSLCKRIYPNFVNCDYTGNVEDPDNPDTYMATMGCRTMLFNDRHGFGYSKVGRGNINPITINLPKIGIKHGICLHEREAADEEGFFKELDEVLMLCEKSLMERFEYLCSQSPDAAPFMYKNRTIRGMEGNDIRSALKHGTNAIGFLGMAETCQAMFGKNHLDPKVHKWAIKVVEHIYNFTKEASDRNDLNFSCYYSPAEGCCYTICKRTRDEFGVIENITDKEFFTNSIHVPVWEDITAIEKIDCEADFSPYGTAGNITYVEFDSKIVQNPDAVESIINYAMDKNVPYFAINFPIETCLDCGYNADIEDACPVCGSDNIERLARVTGYLSTSVERFNKGKQQEVSMRTKHVSELKHI